MKILIAIDGSAGALAGLRHALQWVGDGLKASFVLANVQEPASLYELAVTHDADKLKALRAAAGADVLAPAEALLDAAGVEYESEVAGGDPANLLVELAENYGCEAIVAGARGVGNPHGAGLGPVVQALVERATMPVTVVRRVDEDDLEDAADR
jgi:nucleotide-binding universal stress UspA family protein